MNLENVFQNGILYHHYANTAYPLTPQSFKAYKIKDNKEIEEFLNDQWKNVNEMGIYIHIPFCESRCKFCEYAVLENEDIDKEELYTQLLLKEMDMYKDIINNKKIIGYDMGGGTPSKLSVKNIETITNSLVNNFNISKEINMSIETTPVIASKDFDKINSINKMGYERISMGIQTISSNLLEEFGREGTPSMIRKATENIRRAGFEKFNIDLMYGFLHQKDEDFESTIKFAIDLGPEYITLYRNRYKGTKLEFEAKEVSLEKVIRQYDIAYNLLTESGYEANHGKNTFSKIKGDYGTSDYLTRRVIEGMPYLGMGLGAQSYGSNYISYNEGAATKKLKRYEEKIKNNEFPIQDIYKLPLQEMIAKMVSVAFYFGFIDFRAFTNRFEIGFEVYFKEEIEYVLKNKLMYLDSGRIYLTKKGSDYINGVIPLFYSKKSQEELSSLIK